MIDFEVPKRYGLRQTIADTLGIGGIMRGLRTIPVLLDVCRDMEELCPDVLLLNYVNPMAMLLLGGRRGEPDPDRRALPLACRAPRASSPRDLGLPAGEIDYLVAGINHMAFYLRFERDGEDLYPRAARRGRRRPTRNRVRYEVLRALRLLRHRVDASTSPSTCRGSSRTAAPDLIERFNIPLDEYPRRCERQIARVGRRCATSSRAAARSTSQRSDEYGADIIRACETGEPFAFNGNVPNRSTTGC